MQIEERLRLTLDLDPMADPITGRVGPHKGPGEPFAGYVELIAALERARNGGAEAVTQGNHNGVVAAEAP